MAASVDLSKLNWAALVDKRTGLQRENVVTTVILCQQSEFVYLLGGSDSSAIGDDEEAMGILASILKLSRHL